jgi:hypothetical protein
MTNIFQKKKDLEPMKTSLRNSEFVSQNNAAVVAAFVCIACQPVVCERPALWTLRAIMYVDSYSTYIVHSQYGMRSIFRPSEYVATN